MDYAKLLAKLAGEAASDEVLKKEVIREVIYRESDLLAVGTKVVPTRNFNDLDIKWSYPSELSAEYPVPEGAEAEGQVITWTDFNMVLQRAEVKFGLTDEAKVRQLQNYQLDFSRRRASEALAKAKDSNIINALKNGAGGSKTLASGKEWDASGGSPEDDIVDAIEYIFSNSNIMDSEIKNIAVIVPASVWGELLKLQSINNIMQSLREYFEKSYGIKFYPTRILTDTALVLVAGSDQTAIHGVYNGRDIPLVEEKREGAATIYTVRQYFATVVVPENDDGTSNRIYKIVNVKS